MGRGRGESEKVLHRDYKITFRSGVELEITNCRTAGLAHLLASDYLRSRGRRSEVVSCEVMPVDRMRHQERLRSCYSFTRGNRHDPRSISSDL